MEPEVSVCIATCHRPEGLARLLASLEALDPAGIPSFEVVVVDNAPDPRTREVAAEHSGLPGLRVLDEPRRNIALARNRAVEDARGRWLAFVDDDEVVEPGWLAAHWRALQAPGVDGSFGPVLGAFDAPPPRWLEGCFERRRPEPGAPPQLVHLISGNAVVRASLLAERRFDPEFGRSGGSDTELFGWLRQRGASFVACEDARAVERLPADRGSLGWLSRRAFRGGFLHTRLEQRRRGPAAAALGGLPRAIAGACLLALSVPLAALAGRPAAVRVWLRSCTQAGHLWAFCGRRLAAY